MLNVFPVLPLKCDLQFQAIAAKIKVTKIAYIFPQQETKDLIFSKGMWTGQAYKTVQVCAPYTNVLLA